MTLRTVFAVWLAVATISVAALVFASPRPTPVPTCTPIPSSTPQ